MIVHLLLDRGADIEAAQGGGVRAIHSAAHRDDVAMVRLLVDRGADPSAATDDGRTPADLAHAAMFLMENGFMTGAVLPVDGGHRLV